MPATNAIHTQCTVSENGCVVSVWWIWTAFSHALVHAGNVQRARTYQGAASEAVQVFLVFMAVSHPHVKCRDDLKLSGSSVNVDHVSAPSRLSEFPP